jgi:putative ABC transport system permease protein
MVADVVNRIRSLVRRSRQEDELEAELAFHLEMQAEEHVRRGMDPARARVAAIGRLGGVDQVKEACRDSWGTRLVDTVRRDVTFALRSLRRSPGYTTAVVLTIGLGVGAATAVFSMVDGVLLRGLPYASGDRLVALAQLSAGTGSQDVGFSVTEVGDYRREARTLDAVAEYHSMYFNLFGRGEAQRVQTGVVSAEYFDVLGVRPLIGRLFRASDDRPGAVPVLVLSHAAWQRIFGADPSVIGITVEMNDRVHTVVGVLPPLPPWPDANDVFMPAAACPFRSAPAMLQRRDARMVTAYARLRPGASIEQANVELAGLAARFRDGHPEAYREDEGFTAAAQKARQVMSGDARTPFLVLLGVTGFVLLLVCANVSTMLLARLKSRERELAVRAAVGASRWQVTGQLLAECLVLSLAGGTLGVFIAAWLRDALVAFAARFSPRASEIAVDGRVLLFALGASALAAVLVTLAASLARREQVVPALKEGLPSAAGGGADLRRALVVAQVAIAFVLLVGAGLLTRSLLRIEGLDAGFQPEHVLSVRVDLDWTRYDNASKRRDFYRALLDRVRGYPGVMTASMSLTFPLDESAPFNQGLTVEGADAAPGQPRPLVDFRTATPDYFRAIGVPLVAGRLFTEDDCEDAPAVALVNQSAVRHRFGGLDPVGRRVSLDGGETWITVVGIVGDVRQYSLERAPVDEIYLPLFQRPGLGGILLLRTHGDPLALEAATRQAVRSIDPRQPVAGVRSLEQVRGESLASRRLTALLVGLLALLALGVTCAGVGGVVSFSVGQRTHEIGIRMALGALRPEVVRMLVGQAMQPVLTGLVLGAGGALALSGVPAVLLFEVRPADPLTFLTVSLVLAGIAGAACLVPARRASAVSPLDALREG